jgi:hypothetical protein
MFISAFNNHPLTKKIHFNGIICALALAAPSALTAQIALAGTGQLTFGEKPWNSVAIGGYGAIPDIKANPGKPGEFFISTDVGTLSRFNPATQKWKMLLGNMSDQFDDDTFGSAMSIANNGTTIYALTGQTAFGTEPIGKLWRSDNGGEDWFEPSPTARFWSASNWDQKRGHNRVCVDPRNPAVVFLASRKDLFRSNNGGQTWASVHTPGPSNPLPRGLIANLNERAQPSGISWVIVDGQSSSLPANAQNPLRSSVVYCSVVGRGVFRSADGGANWSQVLSLESWTAAIGLNRTVWATVTDAPVGERGLYRCLPQGGFSKVTNFIYSAIPASESQSDPGAILAGVAVHPTLFNRIAVLRRWSDGNFPRGNKGNGNALYVTTDGGQNWKIMFQEAFKNNRIGFPENFNIFGYEE